MSMAALMERTCEPGHIQISQETAEILASERKSSWFVPRDEKLNAEVKGHIQTYWLHPKREETNIGQSDGASSDTDSLPQNWLTIPDDLFEAAPGSEMLRAHLSEQNQRLAEWNSNQLLKLLNQVALQRLARDARDGVTTTSEATPLTDDAHQRWAGGSDTIIDEVKDCISMPEFDEAVLPSSTTDEVDFLPELVDQQLHDYVSIICSMYRKDLPLHNYHHATTCTMNLVKLLSRMGILARSADTYTNEKLYEKSFGIAADPIAMFGLAFANLIKGVDHPGVMSEQLVAEGSRLSRIYGHTSIIEQNSFSVAWDLLMDPMFNELRSAIYADRDEFLHFRQIVINAVVATDIFDENANIARNKRWEKAFYRESTKARTSDATVATCSTAEVSNSRKKIADQKATLMIDCIMQASDICNTMQHWHLFQKWNERRFKEMCRAFQNGRADINPLDRWYDWQLILFDTRVIPLAKKLKESGCFGSHADEYLNNAKKNREQWFLKGSSIVQNMNKLFAEKHNDKVPKTPSRSSASAPKKLRDGVVRSQSIGCTARTWDNVTGEKISRRGSMDNPPRTPGRSMVDEALADPATVVAEMFSKLPDLRRTEAGRSDGAPTVPRRSFDMCDLVNDAAAVQAMFSDEEDFGMQTLKREVSDGAPKRPRRSCDSMSLSADVRAVQAMLSEDMHEPEMRQIISDRILNVPGGLFPIGGSDLSPNLPVRRQRPFDDESTVRSSAMVFGLAPEQEDPHPIVSLQQEQERSLRSYRSRLDGSYVSGNDESTILTMGHLWTPNHECNTVSCSCSDDDDGSTVKTKSVA